MDRKKLTYLYERFMVAVEVATTQSERHPARKGSLPLPLATRILIADPIHERGRTLLAARPGFAVDVETQLDEVACANGLPTTMRSSCVPRRGSRPPSLRPAKLIFSRRIMLPARSCRVSKRSGSNRKRSPPIAPVHYLGGRLNHILLRYPRSGDSTRKHRRG